MIWGLLMNVLLTIVEPIAAILGQFFQITGIENLLEDYIEPYLNLIIVEGTKLLYPFVDFQLISDLLKIVVIIEAGMHTYKIIMWALKKIPFASITE